MKDPLRSPPRTKHPEDDGVPGSASPLERNEEHGPAPSPQYEYWAFISYSHKDRTTGEWLHRAIETRPIPTPLAGRDTPLGSIPSRLVPVFRDRDELAVSADLGQRIEEALTRSRYLIVVCSPSAAASTWVNKEIAFFKSLGRGDRIFSLIVGGEPFASEVAGREAEECFPTALRVDLSEDGALSTARVEPLAADLRAGGDGPDGAVLKLIAGILGVGLDALRQRDLERRNDRLRRLLLGSLVALAFVAALGVFAILQQRRAEEQSRVSLSRQLAAQGLSLIPSNDELPLLLSLEGLRAANTAEARQTLYQALTARPHPIALLRPLKDTSWTAVAASPDGTTLVSGSSDGHLAFWDLAAAHPTADVHEAHAASVTALAISRDGRRLISAGADGAIWMWDMPGRQRLGSSPLLTSASPITAAALRADDQIAFGTDDGSFVLNTRTGWQQPIPRANPHYANPPTDLQFDTAGNVLAYASEDGTWLYARFQKPKLLEYHNPGDFWSVATSPDGEFVATGGRGLVVHQVKDGQRLRLPVEEQRVLVTALTFSADSKIIISANEAGTVTIWDRPDWPDGGDRPTGRTAPSGRRATSLPPPPRIPTARVSSRSFTLRIGSIKSLVLSPDGRRIFARSADTNGPIAMVALNETPLRRDLVETGQHIDDFGFQPKGEILVSARTGSLTFWDVARLKNDLTLDAGLGKFITSVAFSDDGQTLASSVLGRVVLWDLRRQRRIAGPFDVSISKWVRRLAFAPDQTTLAVVGSEGEVTVWDAFRGERLATPIPASVTKRSAQSESYIPPHILEPWNLRLKKDVTVRDATFLRDGQRLVTCGDDGEITVWNWRMGERVASPMRVGEACVALAYSPNTNVIVSAALNSLAIWGADSQERIGSPLVGHTASIYAIAVSPDGRLMASGGADGLAILWDIDSRQQIATFRHGEIGSGGYSQPPGPKLINKVAFSSDGRTLATDGPAGRIVLWNIDVSSWQRQACLSINRDLTREEWQRHIGNDVPYRQTCTEMIAR